MVDIFDKFCVFDCWGNLVECKMFIKEIVVLSDFGVCMLYY